MRPLILVTALVFVSLTHPISAAPLERDTPAVPGAGRAAAGPPPGLTDKDRDGIADLLQSRMAPAAANDRFDVIVTFKKPGKAADVQQAVGPFQVKREFTIINGFAATMTAGQIRAAARLPDIFRIEPDFEVTRQNDAANADFGGAAARTNYGVTGAGVTICVADTGIDAAHEQLDSGKVIDWFDAIGGLPAPDDDHGHGTHVAATAAGHGQQSAGDSLDADRFKGVAPGAGLIGAKVLNSAGSGTAAQVIAGVEFCAQHAVAQIISMSLGTAVESDGLGSLDQAVDAAAEAPYYKIPVIAAGNSGGAPYTIGEPGAAERAITVGAVAEWSAPVGTRRHDDGIHKKTFSSRGPIRDASGAVRYIKPDIMAPGSRITSAKSGVLDPNLAAGCADPDFANYITCSGTSMATPFVAGAVALALEADPSLGVFNPSDGILPVEKVRGLLASTAQDRGPAGMDSDWGAGLIDVAALVATASGAATASVASAATEFPTYARVEGSVTPNATWSHQFHIDTENLNVPIGATVTIDGQLQCVLEFLGICFGYEWSPDLEARLIDPNGTVLVLSECPARGECGPAGRVESVSAMPSVAGTYTIEVFPFSGSGSFGLDLSTGPVGTGAPVDTPPTAAITNPTGGTVSGTITVQVDASDTEDALGSLAVEVSTDGGATWQPAPFNGAANRYELAWDTTAVGNGAYTIRARATDSQPQTTNAAQVAVTVDNSVPNTPPAAGITDPGAGATVSGSTTIRVNATDAEDAAGSLTVEVSINGGAWQPTAYNGATSRYERVWDTTTAANGANTIDARATDSQPLTTNAAQVAVTVDNATGGAPTSIHVGDLDGSAVGIKRNWNATVDVLVHDDLEQPVAGAMVNASWTGGYSDTGSCSTGSDGRCSVTSGDIHKKNGTVFFTVTSVTGPLSYSAANHDPDGDSTGTTISIAKP